MVIVRERAMTAGVQTNAHFVRAALGRARARYAADGRSFGCSGDGNAAGAGQQGATDGRHRWAPPMSAPATAPRTGWPADHLLDGFDLAGRPFGSDHVVLVVWVVAHAASTVERASVTICGIHVVFMAQPPHRGDASVVPWSQLPVTHQRASRRSAAESESCSRGCVREPVSHASLPG
jgi:hypothetical protein